MASPSRVDPVQKIIDLYLGAAETLKAAQDLSPNNPLINRDLSALVAVLSQPISGSDADEILKCPAIRAIQDHMWDLLSQAEGAMERFYSAAFDGTNLNSFPYVENYRQLVAAEIGALRAIGGLPSFSASQSVAFVGAGPLPLSAVMLHEQTGLPITCVDCDEQAVALGTAFIRKSGYDRHIAYVSTDGAHYDFSSHPLAFVASLVGNKSSVLEAIRHKTGVERIGIRSAEGMHTLLYRPIDENEFGSDIRFDGRTVATPAIINTTLFARLVA